MAAHLIDILTRRLISIETDALPALRQSESSATLSEHSQSIRDDFSLIERDVQELEMLVEESEASASDLQTIQMRLTSLRAVYRESLLTTKRALDAQTASSRRADLFKGSKAASGRVKSSNDTAEDTLMSTTSDVTDGLRRTLGLMQSELDRSVLSNTLLEESSTSLQLTSDQYSTFSGLLQSSKALIKSLERADVLDRLLVLAALGLFALVCLWIIKRRVLDRGLRVVSLFSGLFSSSSKGTEAVISESTTGITPAAAAVTTATATLVATAVSASMTSTIPESVATAAEATTEEVQPSSVMVEPVSSQTATEESTSTPTVRSTVAVVDDVLEEPVVLPSEQVDMLDQLDQQVHAHGQEQEQEPSLEQEEESEEKQMPEHPLEQESKERRTQNIPLEQEQETAPMKAKQQEEAAATAVREEHEAQPSVVAEVHDEL